MDTVDCFDKFVEDLKLGDILVSFCSSVIECKRVNTDEYMEGLTDEINKVAIAINDKTRFVYNKKYGIIVSEVNNNRTN